MEFPPNSRKATGIEPKRVERVTTASATRRRRGFGGQFRSTFIDGDARTAWQYVIFNVLVPAAKEALAEAGSAGIEKLIYGEARARRGGPAPVHGASGYIAYNQRSRPTGRPGPPQPVSRTARARQSFNEIVIPTRQEAEEVLDRMFDLISKYESVTVADLYELTGLESAHTDHKWGWEELAGASVGRVRGGGYVLNLPEPQSLD
jgi:hypothetical protein